MVSAETEEKKDWIGKALELVLVFLVVFQNLIFSAFMSLLPIVLVGGKFLGWIVGALSFGVMFYVLGLIYYLMLRDEVPWLRKTVERFSETANKLKHVLRTGESLLSQFVQTMKKLK